MNTIFSQMKAPKNEVESQDGTAQWLTEEDIKEIEAVGKTTAIEVGQTIVIANCLPEGWFQRVGYKPTTTLTVTISKLFKNGKVGASVRELHGKTINFNKGDF
jgi:hypothetical protein